MSGALSIALLGALLVGCGGGGGSPNQPPQLSNLHLSRTTFDWMSGGGRATTSATVDYLDPEADITSVRVEVSDGTRLDIPVTGPLPGPTGTLFGSVEISTMVSGLFTAEVWAVDGAGNHSNHLTATLTVVGSARLSELSIAAAPFDSPFQNPDDHGPYTATVNSTTTSTTVTATAEDPNSTLSINGAPIPSGVPSDPFDLVTGPNELEVVVTSTEGSKTSAYTVQILRNALDLTQSAYIKASNTGVDDEFGRVLAFSGNTLVVATTREDSGATGIGGDQDNNDGFDNGAAYVYTRDAQGVWSQQEYIKASNSQIADGFGADASIDGDTLVVGAPGECSRATGVNGDQSDNFMCGAGAAYVFARDQAGTWTQHAYVKASNTGKGDGFGRAVVIDGDTVAIGAPGETGNSIPGAAYVFVDDPDEGWGQVAYVKPSDAGRRPDHFGHALDLDGDTLVVGAPDIEFGGPATNTGGKVYVFTRDTDGAWGQQALIHPSTVEGWHRFGSAVAVDGDTLVVGAPNGGDDSSGAVYVFTRDLLGTWTERARILATNTDRSDKFGSSVDVLGDRLVVGAAGEDNGLISGGGAAYVFVRLPSGQWGQRAYVRADNRDARDEFGAAIVVTPNGFIVGAPFEDSAATGIDGDQSDNGAEDSGAVYEFKAD